MIFKHQAYTDFVKSIKNFLCDDEYTVKTYTIRCFFLSRMVTLFYIKLSFYEFSNVKYQGFSTRSNKNQECSPSFAKQTNKQKPQKFNRMT